MEGTSQIKIDYNKLLFEARKAASAAYCPYSNFAVGAAVFCENGQIILGCNVENTSYGLTICAERNALAASVVQGCSRPLAIAVYSLKQNPCYPCGACLQVMVELNRHLEVVLENNGSPLVLSLEQLLPFPFNKDGRIGGDQN
ncbi:cytidine deaminase [Thermovirga lienii DSM 17291]|jgi:cytidine deaminase|uniref:Cytidine deaminase n=1 Tax=Thermovirga lienii (strain ATCC BAA-1197 / DSM 17291 / Cas60314) TaxID=580340 RepID=G7V9G2_THELD|nr:cytidine deaminase [Thermovirga lienii]AER66512.1 cytidine deaminase [Thermovirga lienii DSM 17291]MDN5318696.1 cytidine deaminase [Thermovirga sp.]MDN5367438.1 cytidine deaminase [Thermovirga sp.]HCD71253.1 cytidine deaminase [Thermovirga lienii]